MPPLTGRLILKGLCTEEDEEEEEEDDEEGEEEEEESSELSALNMAQRRESNRDQSQVGEPIDFGPLMGDNKVNNALCEYL